MLIAAATSLEEPDILILDEPTNHLDIAHLNRLEDWLLNNTRVPMLIVSHDREFLNKITNRTIFLRPDGAHVFKAPFAQAREELLQRDEANAKQRHLEEKEIDRLHKMAMRYKAWGVLNSNFHKRQKATEKRIDRLKDERTDAYVAKDRELKLSDVGMEAKVALRLENLTVTTPDKSRVLYKIERLLIHPGDRIALLGANGAGKTMLLSAIAAAYDPKREHYDSTGAIRFSPSAKTVFFDQRMKQLPLDTTPLAYVIEGNVASRSNASAVLAKAGFSYERSQNPIKGLQLRGTIAADLSAHAPAAAQFLPARRGRPTISTSKARKISKRSLRKRRSPASSSATIAFLRVTPRRASSKSATAS